MVTSFHGRTTLSTLVPLFNSKGTMDDDIKEKRAIYIQTCMNLNQQFESLPCESQLKLLNLFNSHFTGSNCWRYDSEKFQQFMNSYNVNIRVIFDLPYSTASWLVEELGGGRHPRQQIYKRFCKFVNVLAGNRKPSIRALFNTVAGDVRSLIGANCRKILADSGVLVSPGTTRIDTLNNYRVYTTPEDEAWKLPLMISLQDIKSQNWEVLFDEECDEQIQDNDLIAMIDEVATC